MPSYQRTYEKKCADNENGMEIYRDFQFFVLPYHQISMAPSMWSTLISSILLFVADEEKSFKRLKCGIVDKKAKDKRDCTSICAVDDAPLRYFFMLSNGIISVYTSYAGLVRILFGCMQCAAFEHFFLNIFVLKTWKHEWKQKGNR